MTASRKFIPSVRYDDGWWAYVSVDGASPGYWRKPRFTRWGATFASRRVARKLNRLERRGLLR
jgi:hypothetical protein